MSAKSVRVSLDGVNFVTLPGSTAEISSDSATVDDSIFGTNFSSSQPTLITWNLSSNGFFKGFPGYRATLKRAGTPTTITDEATAAEADGYYIVDRAKSVLAASGVVVNDAGSPVAAADIEYIDYLQGGVVFVDAYTPSGAITITGQYLPTSRICYAQTFSLTQSADTENVTDLCEAQDNNGFGVFAYQQQNVELSLDGFYNDGSPFLADLLSRDQVIIEINPDGEGKSTARGYFRATSHSQSGDVGSTETESATYALTVPENTRYPFKWYHTSDASLPTGIKMVLDAWEKRVSLFIEYTSEGSSDTRTGEVLVSDTSLEGGVEEINEFSFDFQGSGELV